MLANLSCSHARCRSCFLELRSTLPDSPAPSRRLGFPFPSIRGLSLLVVTGREVRHFDHLPNATWRTSCRYILSSCSLEHNEWTIFSKCRAKESEVGARANTGFSANAIVSLMAQRTVRCQVSGWPPFLVWSQLSPLGFVTRRVEAGIDGLESHETPYGSSIFPGPLDRTSSSSGIFWHPYPPFPARDTLLVAMSRWGPWKTLATRRKGAAPRLAHSHTSQ